ncbi:GtrA family protein [Sinomonas sp. ASV322]|uniref:GtrA family protein n=1 Tax=Sinomonas sp. ASV322 TaxID=3041920 RepID=UPI0027DD0578|nr:GtrA family protein [Sinomonas sp. ASV322]MDQ4502139.1 GtrA family protein [Sinomonas sp. ASV322]
MDQPWTSREAPSAPARTALAPKGLRRVPGSLLEAAWRRPLIRQLTRFTGVGIVCTVTSLALYALCRPWLGPQLANAVALIATSVMNTALNRRFTFKITERRGLAQDHIHGLVAMGVALLLTSGSLWALLWLNPVAGVAVELWTTTIAGWVATAVRFTLLRHWIFRRARNA